jgi:hypothetical protein
MDNAIAEKLVASINRLADMMAAAGGQPTADVVAPTPTPEPTPAKRGPKPKTKEEAPAITLDSLIVRLKAYVAKDEAANGAKVKQLNQSFGIAKLTALDPSKFAEWSEKLKELEEGSEGDDDGLV